MNDPRIEQSRQKALEILKPDKNQLEHGLTLHREATVVDCFGFTPCSNTANMVETLNRLVDEGAAPAELHNVKLEMRILEQAYNEQEQERHLALLREAGITCVLQQSGLGGWVQGLRHMSRFIELCACLAPSLRQARTTGDILAAKKDDAHCLMFSTNGVPVDVPASDFEEGLQGINVYYRLGVRMMHLTYNRRNAIGDGCVERSDGGLSEFGQDVVRYMNKVGVLVDTAHSSPKTTTAAARVSGKPVVASHSCCRAVYHHDRGKTDESIKALAESGGLVGICCIPHFLGERGNIASLLDHIDHVVKLVGVDHVGIGTDIAYVAPDPDGVALKPFPAARPNYSGGWRPEHQAKDPAVNEESVRGSLAWTNWPLYTVGLVTRGYSDEDILKIIGGNMLRVLAALVSA